MFLFSKYPIGFPHLDIENQGKITQKWEYFAIFEVFFRPQVYFKAKNYYQSNFNVA